MTAPDDGRLNEETLDQDILENKIREGRPAEKPPQWEGLPRRITRWQAEFPYHWDADDLVGRRELLRFAVAASGTLFAATAGITLLGQIRPVRVSDRVLAARVGDLGREGFTYFTYPTRDDQAVLLHRPDGRYLAYSTRCTHLSCAVYYDPKQDKLLCPCHNGVFEPQTGAPIAGPPQRPLPRIILQREGDTFYATEEVPQ